MSNLISGLEQIARVETIDYGGWPNPFDDDGVQYAFDSTSLGLLKTCPRKYFLSMVLNWRPKKRSHHLEFGIHYHTGIEIWLKAKVEGLDHEAAVRKAIRQIMINSFGYEPGLRKGLPDNTKTRETLIRALVWYFEKYREDNCKTVTLSNGKAAVELSFRFEIQSGLMLCGHLDQIVNFGDEPNMLYGLDHKTTSSTVTGASASYFFSNFNPDNQMTLYSTAARIAFHTPVKGMIIDAAQMAVGFIEFSRDFTHRTDAHIQEFLEGVVTYRRMAEMYTRQGFWPMNESSCGNYGGCAFRDICSKSPQVRERFLRTDFTQDKPWNPLEPR